MKALILASFLAVASSQPEPPDELSGFFVSVWKCGHHIHSAAIMGVKDGKKYDVFRVIHPAIPFNELVEKLKRMAHLTDPTANVHVLMVEVGGACNGTGT